MSHEKKSHLSDKNVHFKSYKSYIIKVRTKLTTIRMPLKLSNIRQGQYLDGRLFGGTPGPASQVLKGAARGLS